MLKIPRVILLIDTSRTYGYELLLGIARYSHIRGPWVFYNAPGSPKKMIPYVRNWAPDGIIVESELLIKVQEFIPAGLPTIVLTTSKKEIPNVPNIIGDWMATGKMAAEHLLDQGFYQFGFCGVGNREEWSRKRAESFCKRVAESGFKANIYNRSLWNVMHSWESERNRMGDWLKSLPKPLGLMVCHDDYGRYVAEACKIAGLQVPDEIAIIGVNNDKLACGLSNPPLSSIALNTKRAGYEAAELLDKLMAGEKIENQRIIVHPTHVVTRQSTDILAIEDRDVAEAVRFIRQHAKEPIQVGDVVGVAAVSRRALEQRFRKILDRSISDEIGRVRAEQISKMLIETNMPVSQIALALGYHNDKHISRCFRREKGMSPLAYRKHYS